MSGTCIQLVDLYLPTEGSWEPQQQRRHSPAALPSCAYLVAWRAQHACLDHHRFANNVQCMLPPQLGMGAVHEYEEGLARQLYQELSQVRGIRILGPPPDVPQVRAIGPCGGGVLQHWLERLDAIGGRLPMCRG